MCVKNLRNSFLILSAIFFCRLQSAVAAPKYPSIQEVRGQVWVSGKENKKQLLSKKSVLLERALLETSETGLVKISLDAQRSFTVLGDSTVLLPTISNGSRNENREVPIIILSRGRLRWQQLSNEKPAYNTALHSDLFEFIIPQGDFVFSMNLAKAFASVKVLKGSLEFSALNGEDVAAVKEGQEVGFQGVLEGSEIAYDVLLKGKKIPRGHLTPVTAIDKKELASFSDEPSRAQKILNKKRNQERTAGEKARKANTICLAPEASFNQCAWVCLNNPKKEKKDCLTGEEGTSCVRRRCNANGQWSEESPIDVQKSSILCEAKPIVAPCDY